MIAELARAAGRDVPRETFEKVDRFAALLIEESQRQNLISRASAGELWERHLLDSAQLVRFAPAAAANWADVGSGAGLPGLVVGILTGQPTILIEPRRLRADFLRRCVEELALPSVQVVPVKAERFSGSFDVISARALAPLGELLSMTVHLAHRGTRWILPKGRSGAKELAQVADAWQGQFRTEPSITDPEAVVLVADAVEPRGGTRT
jgi:16S rRNA (guanine527-N7)-methyltransferase